MKKLILLLFLATSFATFSQDDDKKEIDLSEFQLANISSPAFVLINESPSEIYVPENLKSLTIHALNNFSEGLSIEVSPYYFLNTKSEDRTFFKYLGISDDGKKQNAFSGLNTTTVSFAYANKEFEGLTMGERKVFSLGLRTKLLRFYNKSGVTEYHGKVSKVLAGISYPNSVLQKLVAAGDDEDKKTKIVNDYLKSKDGRNQQKALDDLQKDIYKKPLKPIFQIDYALGYSSLFKENNVDSGTLNRFGSWMTAELSLQLNKKAADSKTNNYLNVFAISRYIEDGFNTADVTMFYRDLGTKVEFEFGKFSFGYEYIDRNGSIDSERSVGTIKYVINKNVSLNGGFGKDFEVTDNLVTLFGINWGLSTGSD
jgi:hypothetical protein